MNESNLGRREVLDEVELKKLNNIRQKKLNQMDSFEELSYEQIMKMANMHNEILNNIHMSRGDVYLYSENEKLELVEDLYNTYMSDFRDITLKQVVDFSKNVAGVEKSQDLLIYDWEKMYIDQANQILFDSSDIGDLNMSLDKLVGDVKSDNRKMFKTPILLYIETLKESSFYWASVEEGGSGLGFSLLKKRSPYFMSNKKGKKNWKNVAIADAQGMTTGMLGVAAYGAWGVMFGPAGFALTGGAFVWVAVESAMASALFG
ncbi:hypothetical protein AB4865_11155 [Capnocytophaga sp. ARDL2]|uniref:hypothetical protein n=1 Tax=Capnocytophaga sp. ARDL2 TaxID=3238809 RepID=UPI003558BA79